MGSLVDETEVALGRVLGLCSGGAIVQQDVEALQRHDEAALGLLDVNDGDAMKALRPWTKCLEAWAREGTSSTLTPENRGGRDGPWTTITQPCAVVLSKSGPSLPTPAPSAVPPLAAHKALPVVLFRVMLIGDEVQGSPHRTPSPAAWAAARAYLLMLSLPGAAAYGVLQPALMGMVLTNLRSWCRNSAVYRPGGGSDAAGKKRAPQKRRRGEDDARGGDEGSDDDGDSDGENRRRAGGKGGRGGGGSGGGGAREEVQACLELLKTCLACVPLASHQDLAVKLSEVLVGVSVIASVEGPAFSSLAAIASESMVTLVASGAPGGQGQHGSPIHGVVLQALMPVILMATGKPDVPPRSRDCVKAHHSAIEITKAIAAAVRNANPQGSDVAPGSPPSTPGQNTGAVPGENSAAKTLSGGEGGGDDAIPSPTGDAPSATPSPAEAAGSAGGGVPPAGVLAVGCKGDGNRGGGGAGASASPVLTMVQHLCVSAPERAEGRARLAEGLASLLPELADTDRARFVSFLAKLSRSAKIVHRGFAVELSSRLLTEPWTWAIDDGDSAVDSTARPSTVPSPIGNGDAGAPSISLVEGGGKTMLGLVVARAADTAPTVRSKAASTLADVIAGIQGQRNGYKVEAFRRAVMEACGWGGAGPEGRGDGPLLEVVRTRVEDEKANVRRNAVPALEALLKLSPAFGGGGAAGSGGVIGKGYQEDFGLLQERCNDVSLSTRKAAMGALSSLLMLKPSDEALQAAWVSSVLPLAADPEQTCQNRLVELVRTVVLDRVVEWHKAEAEVASVNVNGNGKGRRGRQPPRGVNNTGVSDGVSVEDVAAAAMKDTNAERVSSVWSLLAKAGQGDAHKCLKKAVSVLMLQKGTTGFKPAPLLRALRAAAVMALPPKPATAASAAASSEVDGGEEEELHDEEGEEAEAEEWAAGDLRLLSLAEKLPGPTLTTIRRGTWVLLDAFFDRVVAPGQSISEDGKDKSDSTTSMAMDPMFVVQCWKRIRVHIVEQALSAPVGDSGEPSPGPEEAFESDGRRVLGVLARLASKVPAVVAVPLAESLLEMLLDLVATPETSAALVAALHMLCFAQADTEEAGAAMCNQWANEALQKFERLLDLFVYQGSEAFQDHSGARACGFDMALLVERLVFAVGEVALVGFTGKEDAAGPSDPQVPGAAKGKKKAQPVNARPTPSPRLVELVQVLLPPRLPTSAHGVEEGEQGPEIPSPVRALAFVTLGKLCLRDKALAKRSVNLFVRELDTAAAPAVRSNALVVLGDLCVRYTAMVDRHVAAMAACLQDSHPMVRRHAILLISQLLLQDYVKWRGLLLYRFLATIVDSDASVRNLGAFTLTQPLITKTPGLFAQNLVETLFVLNNYSEHPCYAAAAAGRVDAGGGITMEGIDLGGDSPGQIRKRMSVYSTMLEHMSDEQKITVTAKLAQEVLSAAIDGGLPLTDSGSAALAGGGKKQVGASSPETRKKASAVVKDALTIMASPGIRVGGGRGGGAGGADLDDGAEDMGSQQGGQGGLAAAKRTLLSKVALKHLMEKVVPILTALKHVLERAHSPLLREIMFYFGELFRSHKEEVKAVLASEPGLVEEIDFDLRRFEKEEHERRQKTKEAAAAAASAVGAASGSGMGPPRTPRRRRSSMGGAASGRRDSFAAPGLRDACTPMAAVAKSARNTPFQNLGACSAVKLKPPTPGASIFSPVRRNGGGGAGAGRGGRTSRPKTPVHLRTPRQAVAAALGNSPMDTDTSPVPIKSMLSRAASASSESASRRGSGDRADIELDSPVNPHAAKKKRTSGSAPAPTPTQDGAAADEEFDDVNGVRASKGSTIRTLAKEGGRGQDGVEDDGVGKENHPVTRKHASSDGNPGGKKQSIKGKGKGREGVKGSKASSVSSSSTAAAAEAVDVVADKQTNKSHTIHVGGKETEDVGKRKTAPKKRATKKQTSAVVSSESAAVKATTATSAKTAVTAVRAPARRSSRTGRN